MTSFFTAACQYLTAIGCLHTLAETMYRFSATFVRLIGSFFTWHFITFFLLQINFRIYFYTQQGTIPVVCERTAKVRENKISGTSNLKLFCHLKRQMGRLYGLSVENGGMTVKILGGIGGKKSDLAIFTAIRIDLLMPA